MMTTHSVHVRNIQPFPVEPLGGKKWQPVFFDVSRILSETKMNWQVGGGTLLGFVRQGDVIPHDTDLDYEIFLEEYNALDFLVDVFVQEGYAYIREQTVATPKGRLSSQLAFLHEDTNIIVDIYVYYVQEEGGNYVNYNEHGVLLRPIASVRETKVLFVEALLDGVEVPSDVEQYLVFRYGSDWKTPKEHKTEWTADAGDALQ
jgi:hypothetical protein